MNVKIVVVARRLSLMTLWNCTIETLTDFAPFLSNMHQNILIQLKASLKRRCLHLQSLRLSWFWQRVTQARTRESSARRQAFSKAFFPCRFTACGPGEIYDYPVRGCACQAPGNSIRCPVPPKQKCTDFRLDECNMCVCDDSKKMFACSLKWCSWMFYRCGLFKYL